ncbi:hypothetical protein [Capsulimonas corticalis]|nr:hypothetical protein [Capsulimonas corticalis]
MMSLLRRRSVPILLALALSLAAAFVTRWRYVHMGFYGPSPDDYDWIK